MREITFKKPVSKKETRKIECAYNLGSKREREIVDAALRLAAEIARERPSATWLDFKPTDDAEWALFALAVRVFMPHMEALRAAETN
jgi:hypothetical protein